MVKPAMIDFEVPVKKVIDKEIKKHRGEEVKMCSITLAGDERTVRGAGIGEIISDEAHGKVTVKVEMECTSADVINELLRAAPDEYVRIKVEELPSFTHPRTGERAFGREAIDALLDKIATQEQKATESREQKEYKDYQKIWKAQQKLDIKEADTWTDEQIVIHSEIIPTDILKRIKAELKEKEKPKGKKGEKK